MNKSEIMKRAWAIYRTLIGDRAAKLSAALKQAWAEAKNPEPKATERPKTRRDLIAACVDDQIKRGIVKAETVQNGLQVIRHTSEKPKYEMTYILTTLTKAVTSKATPHKSANFRYKREIPQQRF